MAIVYLSKFDYLKVNATIDWIRGDANDCPNNKCVFTFSVDELIGAECLDTSELDWTFDEEVFAEYLSKYLSNTFGFWKGFTYNYAPINNNIKKSNKNIININKRIVYIDVASDEFDKGTVIEETNEYITIKSFVHKDVRKYNKKDINKIKTIDKPKYESVDVYDVFIDDNFDNRFEDYDECIDYINRWIETTFNTTPYDIEDIVDRISIKPSTIFKTI